MNITRMLKGAVALVACLAGSFLIVEFALPSMRSSSGEKFGRVHDVQVELVTRRSPFLGRAVGREVRITGRFGSLVRGEGTPVCDRFWAQRDDLRREAALLPDPVLAFRPNYDLLLAISLGSLEDAELHEFIRRNSLRKPDASR